ncbi:HpaII family restriction endonuclease [Gelidibacter salicanalis]|uniref:HpaII family restriction endonuclease n=1 Tax=Gelidibacter salicanalis TaxID=291193 RepID=A0A934KN23_9FLAO|nr:HpaII family restriction endonuclease [Gelidibacter salicanalis]MBJ7882247.1 HpaII family restriction endonuclease [Gelidibacter salicanalis]
MDIIKNIYRGYSFDKASNIGDGIVYKYDSTNEINKQKVSIKSFLDRSFSFLNANKSTSIVYKITSINNAALLKKDYEEINSIMSRHKYIDRVTKLIELGYNIEFYAYDDSTFKLNLQVIDSELPKIIAHIVKDIYVSRISKLVTIQASI